MYPIVTGIFLVLWSSCALFNGDRLADQNKAQIYYSHGTSLLVEKKYTKALKILQQAYELDPADSKINNNLGMVYYFKGSIPKAIEHLNKAIERNGDNFDARNNLASVYFNSRNYDEAIAQYKIIERELSYESRYRTLYNIALVYDAKGQLSQAINYLKLSLKENKDYCPSSLQLALYSYRAEDYPRALKLFKDARMGPCVKNPEPHYYMAETLIHLKKYAEARTTFLYVKERFPLTKYVALSDSSLEQIPAVYKREDYISKAKKMLESMANENQKTIQGTKF